MRKKKKDFTSSSTWREEITSRARKASINIKFIGGIIILFFLLGVATLNILGIIVALCIKDTIVKLINSLSAFIALLFSLKILPSIRELYVPKMCYYRAAAFELIEGLSQKGMTPQKKSRLKEIAIKYLGALETGNSQAKPEDLLNKACRELSETYKDK